MLKSLQLLALASVLTCVTAGAQTASAPKPQIRSGDTAVYTVNLLADRQVTEDTFTVTSIDGGQVKVVHTRANRTPPEREAIYADDWSPLVSGGTGARFEPSSQSMSFPLEVGKAWETKYVVTAASGAKSRASMDNKVVGVERIRTPAGEFDTFKVVNEGWINGVSWNGSFRVSQTLWYAPAINWVVKSSFKEHRRDGAETISEMKSFTPGK